MIYKIVLEKTYLNAPPTYFEFGSTNQYEVMRHWCKFFENNGYKYQHKQYMSDNKLCIIYVSRTVKGVKI